MEESIVVRASCIGRQADTFSRLVRDVSTEISVLNLTGMAWTTGKDNSIMVMIETLTFGRCPTPRRETGLYHGTCMCEQRTVLYFFNPPSKAEAEPPRDVVIISKF